MPPDKHNGLSITNNHAQNRRTMNAKSTRNALDLLFCKTQFPCVLETNDFLSDFNKEFLKEN